MPQPLIRGTRDDRPVDLNAARYTGLGCGVQALKKGAILHAYLQDQDSGMVVAVSREFSDPADAKQPPPDYSRLAQTSVMHTNSQAALGAGTLLLAGGRRTPARRLIHGRARATVNPQACQWENLREPLRADSFTELRARCARGASPTTAGPARRIDRERRLRSDPTARRRDAGR